MLCFTLYLRAISKYKSLGGGGLYLEGLISEFYGISIARLVLPNRRELLMCLNIFDWNNSLLQGQRCAEALELIESGSFMYRTRNVF